MKKLELKQNILTRQWRWKIKANNGKIIGASSESFYNKKDCIANAEMLGKSLTQNFKDEI